MVEKNSKINELFGVNEDVLEKSKDIYPSFDIGKLEEESMVSLKIISEEPKLVTHPKKFNLTEEEEKAKKKGEDVTEETGVLVVEIASVFRPDKKTSEMLEVPYNNEQYSLWLSSKSLSMGLARIYQENENSLKNMDVKITIGKANYKQFGENTCYRVSKIQTS